MKHTIITLQPSQKPKPPLDIQMLRNFLHLDCDDGDQELLEEFSIAAMEHLEQIMIKSIIKRQWKVVYGNFYDNKVELPMGPVVGIESVTLKNIGSLSKQVDVGLYGNSGNRLWFSCMEYGWDMVEVVYVAGMAESFAEVPAMIKESLLQTVARMYEGSRVRQNFDELSNFFEYKI